ncbi:uncharacterized protein LOC122847895 [Aphidius gifuensis]|uniref:uncharacterized protein LOC122847895 n=1 Tax=Aphidius gifuensis TaxID=684658 RepID=UPI001CDCA7D3|nr:uncharacterized protein LOC122847895 [Aphidius gifuensis]
MSGILKNTLRLVGIGKYAPINSTKYLRSMTITTSRMNSSLLSEPNNNSNNLHHHESEKLRDNQAIQHSTDFRKTIRAAGNKILSIISDEELKTLDINNFTVSLDNGKVGLITPKRFFGRKDLIFPPTFSIELNDKSIEPKSNKIDAEEEKTSFKLGNWYGSVDGGKLSLTLKDSNETFILKHTVYVKAHNNPPKYSENDGLSAISPKLDPDYRIYSAKIISKPEGSKPLERSYSPAGTDIPAEQLLKYGHTVAKSHLKISNGEVTDGPDEFGKMKLKFPMTVVVEGGQQKIKIKDTDDDFNVYHKVEIQAYNEPAKNIRRDRLSKNGLLKMQLTSGNLKIEEKNTDEQWIITRQEVDIEIDLDSEIPSIRIDPHVKTFSSIH